MAQYEIKVDNVTVMIDETVESMEIKVTYHVKILEDKHTTNVRQKWEKEGKR